MRTVFLHTLICVSLTDLLVFTSFRELSLHPGVSARCHNQVDSFYLKAYRISWRDSSKKITWWLTFCAGEVLQGIADDHGQTAEEKGKASCSVGRREYWGTNRTRGNFKMASESGWELATWTKREGNSPESFLRIC